MPTISVNGEEIAYERAGSGAPLVLIHSLGTGAWLWREQMRRWSARFDVVAMDLRGHGRSSCHRPFTVSGAAADLEALALALGLGAVGVVCISMGGPIAAHWNAAAPSRIRRLVIADSFATQGEAGGQRAAMIAAAIERDGMPAYGRQYAQETLADDLPRAAFDTLAAAIGAIPSSVYIQAARSVFTSDVVAQMKAISVPTHVVVGSRDQRTPPHLSRQIVSLVDGAGYAEIEDARHLANLDRPDRFHAAVDPFLFGAA